MAVIVDTAAWVEFFKPQGSTQVKSVMTAALEEGLVVTVAPILVELLVGLNAARRTDARAIDRLRDLAVASLDWNACELAGKFGRTLAGRQWRVPTVDLQMAGAAALAGHEIWHVGDKLFVTDQADRRSARTRSIGATSMRGSVAGNTLKRIAPSVPDEVLISVKVQRDSCYLMWQPYEFERTPRGAYG